MDLRRSKSGRAFQHNIRTEEKRGKSKRRAVGVAFGEADLAKKRDTRERKKDAEHKRKLDAALKLLSSAKKDLMRKKR